VKYFTYVCELYEWIRKIFAYYSISFLDLLSVYSAYFGEFENLGIGRNTSSYAGYYLLNEGCVTQCAIWRWVVPALALLVKWRYLYAG